MDRHSTRRPSYGFSWDAQSCWMDSSLMAMFYPDMMYNALYHQFEHSTKCKQNIKETLMQIVREIREDDIELSLHDFRNLLATETPMTGNQKKAFQRDNKFGYVFYFLMEIQKLFGVKCMTAKPPGTNQSSEPSEPMYVLEMEKCHSGDSGTVSTCLEKTYKQWTFDPIPDDVKHMFIELLDENRYSVVPEETITFQGHTWILCSMIVFDCSHFVSYLKQGDQWYLYDDTRALSKLSMKPVKFGREYYHKGTCRFQYGVQNTFFFYAKYTPP